MLNVLAAVLITLCLSFGVPLRYVPFASLVTAGQKRRLYLCYVLLMVVNAAVLTAAMFLWGEMAAFNYLRFGGIVYAAIVTTVNILVIRGRLREHLFVFGVVLTCNYLAMSVPNYVVALLPGLNITAQLFVVLGVYFAVLLLTHWPFQKLLCNTVEPFLQLNNGEYWNTIWFMPIAFFGTKFLSLGGEHNSGGVLQLLSSLLYIFVIVLMCLSITAAHERMRERQLVDKQLAGQKVHYAELKARVEETRKARHDFKHYIAAIRHYMDIDDKEGLRRYCDELVGYTDEEGRIPYTGNVAADGVLYHYIQLSKREHIDFKYFGTIHSHGIADVDLSALLGNALDNAFAGCLTIPQGREITLVSQSEKQLLSIVVRNTFDGTVEQSEEGLLSRKRKNSRGVGIASMRSICERYGGSMDLRWDEHSFTIVFVLPLAEEQ